MSQTYTIDNSDLTFKKLAKIISENHKIALSSKVKDKITSCRTYLDQKMKSDSNPIYGINTGFGSLYNVKIEAENLHQLQENLVMSHACGTGDEVPQNIVKLMILLKIKSLSYGHSGVQLITVERLVDFYNNDILPVIFTQGSLGASGDLAPLAHLALAVIGKGEVYYKGKKQTIKEVNSQFNWKAIQLQSKEGLALLNGIQFMSAYGSYLILESYKLKYIADLVGTLSLEAFDGNLSPFNELIHRVRPHEGQLQTAKRVRDFVAGSEIISQKKEHVQDPYSFRCIPQVHGATHDTLAFVKKTITTEINAVTDNPNIFVEEDTIISGGNFHGQPLAHALDYLGIAMAELGSISERRTFQLVSGLRGLPAFLIAESGLNSGFMIPQYTAASIVSQNKQLATPASIDSIVSSNGQEDHVSMGANAATKAYSIVKNVERVLAIELLNASQAIHFRNPLKSSTFIESLLASFRKEIPFIEKDIILHEPIKKSIAFINQLSVDVDELFGE
ncbi:MAG TPA: histidine ammonia-lyase [Lutibacter sp.]|nr:histidine ammonia-lyase [Lutibacter sp.]